MAYLHYISRNTRDFLSQQYPDRTPEWINAFSGEVDRLSEKWGLSLSCHEKNSRFGAILYGESKAYGDVAVKIVPWFCSRLETEVYCYRRLPYREMCPLYDVDMKMGALLLKFVPPSQDAGCASREAVFLSLYEQRLPYDGEKSALPRYENVLSQVLSTAENAVKSENDPRLRPFLPSIRRAAETMQNFADAERYVIHGDAHEYNMLTDQCGCVLIDPLGYIAPFDFEYARYFGTAMKEACLSNDEMASLIRRVLPRNANTKSALDAFAVDVTLRACNTFIEGNTYEEICFGGDWARRAWEYRDALACAL